MTSSFYPPYHVGGACFHVKFLAEELAKRGHEVHVLHSVDAYRVKRGNAVHRQGNEGVFTHPIETRFGLSPYMVYLLGKSRPISKRFRALVHETRPDIVHHHNVSLLGYDILQKARNYLNLYTAHDYWLLCPQSTLLRRGGDVCLTASCKFCGLYSRRPPQLWRYRAEFGKAMTGLDLIIAPSTYTRETISKHLPVKVVTIPNFVPEPPQTIARSGFSNFFLFAGRLENYKGAIQLVDSFKELDKRKGSKLIIIGNGSLERAVGDRIKKNGLTDAITQLGWASRSFIYQLLNDAQALIVPSLVPENCPLIALEAFSVGTPVIASDRGGLPEIVEKIDRGLIFESFADLQKILMNFVRNNYPAERTRDIYREQYSAETFFNKYFELIDRRNDGLPPRGLAYTS